MRWQLLTLSFSFFLSLPTFISSLSYLPFVLSTLFPLSNFLSLFCLSLCVSFSIYFICISVYWELCSFPIFVNSLLLCVRSSSLSLFLLNPFSYLSLFFPFRNFVHPSLSWRWKSKLNNISLFIFCPFSRKAFPHALDTFLKIFKRKFLKFKNPKIQKSSTRKFQI